MNSKELAHIMDFFRQKDTEGVTNETKVATKSHEICRLATTDKSKSYETAKPTKSQKQSVNDGQSEYPIGVVVCEDKLIGLGIHILNEDVYPLQSFRIYLRNCDLVGELDLSECRDMIFIDLYHNKVKSVKTGWMPAMRIFGMQDNELSKLDVTGLTICQGIDVGNNHLKELDVSKNSELVELYINNNDFSKIDLTANSKLKYFYCHNNQLTELDVTSNPLLRHMDATGNKMKTIKAFAPQREELLPLRLTAGDGGYVGLKFSPIYNAQWKETGEWQQNYYAYPEEGRAFVGWKFADGSFFSKEAVVIDEYGKSRELTAEFR